MSSLERRPLELAAVVDDVLAAAKRRADAAGVLLERHGDAQVSADARRLTEALLHLVANAIDATPAQGQVRVEIAQHADRIEIVIRDTGAGMPPDVLARVGYFGNHSSRLEQKYEFNNTTPTWVWWETTHTEVPKGEYSQTATRFFDQTTYGTLEKWQNTGWGNSNGIQLELERRYSKGFAYQLFYVMDNNFAAGGGGYSGTSPIPELNQFLPGAVPTDINERNRYYAQAERRFLEALKIDPRVRNIQGESVYGMLGSLYRSQGRIQDAVRCFEEAERVTPHNTYPVINQAREALRKMG